MKIFITGGTGFIGSQLVGCLAGSGHQLVCLARKSSDIRPLQEAGATIVYGDLTDKEFAATGNAGLRLAGAPGSQLHILAGRPACLPLSQYPGDA